MFNHKRSLWLSGDTATVSPPVTTYLTPCLPSIGMRTELGDLRLDNCPTFCTLGIRTQARLSMQSQRQEVGVSCGWKLPLNIAIRVWGLPISANSCAVITAALRGDDVTDGITDSVASGKVSAKEENNRNGIRGNFLFPRTTMNGAAFQHFKTFLGKSWQPAFWLEFTLHYKN